MKEQESKVESLLEERIAVLCCVALPDGCTHRRGHPARGSIAEHGRDIQQALAGALGSLSSAP